MLSGRCGAAATAPVTPLRNPRADPSVCPGRMSAWPLPYRPVHTGRADDRGGLRYPRGRIILRRRARSVNSRFRPRIRASGPAG
jgi:hypothetical protein